MASPSSPFRPLLQAPADRRKISCRAAKGSPHPIPAPMFPTRILFKNAGRVGLLRSMGRDLEAELVFDQEDMQADFGWANKKEEANSDTREVFLESLLFKEGVQQHSNLSRMLFSFPCGVTSWLSFVRVAQSSEGMRADMVYEIGELFELGIQLSYLLTLLGLLGAGTFFVIRQVLVRRELDLSAKELQEQVRSGDGAATAYFELGAVMLRRKFYPAAIKYLQQAIEKWDRDDQDLAQVYNALGVSYSRENKLEKAIAQFEKAVELQPGYTTAWNNLGDAYEKKKDLRAALKAFEEVLLFDPNNKVARPRRDALRDRVQMYKGVPIKSEER